MMGSPRWFMRWLLLAVLLACSGTGFAARTILVYGDSLSAAYGISRDAGWVNMLGERLKQTHPDYTVANASISGETTEGGARRIDGALEQFRPAIVVLALGANDGLRGWPAERTKANLAAIIRAARREKARVLLVGMRMPPNYGARYAEDFRRTFADLAREERVPFVPFLLEGMALDRDMFQDDNFHPNERAQGVLLDNVWRGLAPMLGQAQARGLRQTRR
jgi:acyl-CoA thioesterase I